MSQILIALSLFFSSCLFVFYPPDFKNPSRKPFYFAPPAIIKHFSLGFSELYADILWMRLIQDIDFCDSEKGIPRYDGKKKYSCNEGWSYKMTEAITELAPRFLKPYEMSASIMGIIMGDTSGAKKIYDKGLKNFPDNWKMHFSAGYHYLQELGEEEKAAKLLIRAADLGGPQWLYGLAAKTYSEMGRLLLSREILKEALKKDPGGRYGKAFESRLKEVEEKIKKRKEEGN